MKFASDAYPHGHDAPARSIDCRDQCNRKIDRRIDFLKASIPGNAKTRNAAIGQQSTNRENTWAIHSTTHQDGGPKHANDIAPMCDGNDFGAENESIKMADTP